MAERYHITLAGIFSDEKYQRCLTCLKELQKNGQVYGTVLQFFQTQWDEYIKRVQNDLKGAFYHHKGSPLVILNMTQYIGGVDSFLEWALQNFRYTDKSSDMIYRKLAHDASKKQFNETPGRSYVFMNYQIAANVTSQVIFELFDDIAP